MKEKNEKIIRSIEKCAFKKKIIWLGETKIYTQSIVVENEKNVMSFNKS